MSAVSVTFNKMKTESELEQLIKHINVLLNQDFDSTLGECCRSQTS